MEINTAELKNHSVRFKKKLRLPIKNLKIKIGDNWKTFDNFISDTIETEGGHKLKTQIKKVLLDTGNETEYVILSAYYLNIFKQKIKELKTEEHIIEDFQGNKRLTLVSIDVFEFELLKTHFYSRIGFTYQTNVNALDIINIGIKAIRQFLNIIFPYESNYYYYCLKV